VRKRLLRSECVAFHVQSVTQLASHFENESFQPNEEDELPEDGDEKIEQQYVSNEQVDAEQYRCRPLDARDLCIVVVHLLTDVILMCHTRRVAYVAT